MGRIHRLTFTIYREMLCITRDLDGTVNLTIDGFDHFQYHPFWTPPYRIVLSCTLLTWMTMDGKIPFSFTDFIITTQELLSDPLYINPDIYHTQTISPDLYHTQITEYSLLTFYELE